MLGRCALHLFPTVQSIARITWKASSNRPIAIIKAIHTGLNASKASSEEAGGLKPVIYLAHTALVINLWVEAGLVDSYITMISKWRTT